MTPERAAGPEPLAEEPEDRLGMTPEQWQRFQEATRGYGEQDENGIDLSLLRENLRLTPTQRLERLESSRRFFHEVERAREVKHGRTA
jgi:hypothetical protein